MNEKPYPFTLSRTEYRYDDLKTVLATIIQIINVFLTTKPNYLIAFKGSDQRRQRLYRIVISKELSEIRNKFDVFGGIGDTIHLFESNKQFDYYLIRKYEN